MAGSRFPPKKITVGIKTPTPHWPGRREATNAGRPTLETEMRKKHCTGRGSVPQLGTMNSSNCSLGDRGQVCEQQTSSGGACGLWPTAVVSIYCVLSCLAKSPQQVCVAVCSNVLGVTLQHHDPILLLPPSFGGARRGAMGGHEGKRAVAGVLEVGGLTIHPKFLSSMRCWYARLDSMEPGRRRSSGTPTERDQGHTAWDCC